LWKGLKLEAYDLNNANEALAALAEGRVLKAIIQPQKGT
jgi:hypothetical protein